VPPPGGRRFRDCQPPVCPASQDPLVNLGQLELPEPTDPVSRKALVVDSPVHGVAGDAEMSRNFVYGVPAFVGHVRLPV
jgi:hypothetical protein